MALSHNNAFGLDISDAMLKLVWLDSEAHIRSFHAMPLAKDAMKDGRIQNPVAFKKAVRELIDGVKGDKIATPWVIASLPETHVFVKTMVMPKEEEKGGAEHFVFSKLGEHFPMPLGEVYVAWKAGAKDKTGARRLMVAAAPREVVDEYDLRLHEAGLRVEGLQSESTALSIALLKGWPSAAERKDEKADMSWVLVNFKSDHAVIAFVDDGVILLSMTVQNAKLAVDDFIVRIEEKIELGNAWRERDSGKRFKRVIIAGGDDFQERLFSDIRQKKSYRVEIGDPYANLCAKKDIRHEIHRLPNSFATAIGLALGSR